MDTIEKLEKRQAEISAKIAARRASLSALLIEGRDTSKQLDELGKLEAEASAITPALEMARRQAAEESAAAWQQQAAAAANEIEQINARRDEIGAEMFDLLVALRSLVGEYQSELHRAQGLRASYKLEVSIPTMGKSADIFKTAHTVTLSLPLLERPYPELFGLPANLTHAEVRLDEARAYLERAEHNLELIKEARGRLANGANCDDRVKDAEAVVKLARTQLDQIQKTG